MRRIPHAAELLQLATGALAARELRADNICKSKHAVMMCQHGSTQHAAHTHVARAQ